MYREAFGIRPEKPLKSLIIQAEMTQETSQKWFRVVHAIQVKTGAISPNTKTIQWSKGHIRGFTQRAIAVISGWS